MNPAEVIILNDQVLIFSLKAPLLLQLTDDQISIYATRAALSEALRAMGHSDISILRHCRRWTSLFMRSLMERKSAQEQYLRSVDQ